MQGASANVCVCVCVCASVCVFTGHNSGRHANPRGIYRTIVKTSNVNSLTDHLNLVAGAPAGVS